MDWEECCKKRIVKEVNPDLDMAKALEKSSKNKLESADKLEISAVTASSKLSLAYDSLRELLEALALKKGYKVYNHECYAAFIKEVLKDSEKGDEFDDVRKERNNVNYYGKEISVEEAEIVIFMIRKVRSFIEKLLETNPP